MFPSLRPLHPAYSDDAECSTAIADCSPSFLLCSPLLHTISPDSNIVTGMQSRAFISLPLPQHGAARCEPVSSLLQHPVAKRNPSKCDKQKKRGGDGRKDREKERVCVEMPMNTNHHKILTCLRHHPSSCTLSFFASPPGISPVHLSTIFAYDASPSSNSTPVFGR